MKIELDFINEDIFLNYFIKKADKFKIKLNEKILAEILDFTKGHPYYSQLFFQEYIILKKINNNLKLNFQKILEASSSPRVFIATPPLTGEYPGESR